MKCKLCGKKKTGKNMVNNCWGIWQICGSCVDDIQNHKNRNFPNRNSLHSQCLFCGKDLPMQVATSRAFCDEGHKARYYRRLRQQKENQALWKRYEILAQQYK